ncbi:hypothetical protein LPJ53_005177 [Coemansia erecta]|uniref:Ion transport domain-containing protein n=1 Tax=Coemansia erecta TaxID=147472 RepID=A0A9W7XW73_9FUNG|nr:hypothetical protein LPJ53_005177 [Coemansia erecta]
MSQGRKSSDSHGFEEATFVTSPEAREPAAPLHAPAIALTPPAGHSDQAGGRSPTIDAAVIEVGADRALEGSAAMAEAAAAAAVGATTPPAEDPERWYQEQIDYVRTQVEQMESVDNQRGQEAKSIRSKWKRELFLLFEDPSSSPAAFVINVFVTFMIIFSAVLTTIETIPALRKGNSQMWMALELIIVAVFTLEFLLRFLGHTDSWRQAWAHIKSVVTVVDALAIFPFYVELLLRRDTSYEFRFTILRIFRLLRVFSAFKYSSLLQLSIEVMIVAIKRSADALLAFLLFVTLTVLLFSTLMYFAERGTWDDERQAFLTSEGEYSKFSSIPAAAYYSIVTLTTTGFGDMVPTTFIGKLVSFPMMIAGILLIALPSIIVGRNFTQVWEAARKYRSQRAVARAQRIGDTLMDDDEDDGEHGGEGARRQRADDDAAAQSSGRSSRRSNMRRRQRRRRYAAGGGGGGSISSFETGSAHMSVRSPMEKPGGYTTVFGGQTPLADTHGDGSYDRHTDPIDALARKDSFEMQELASRASDPEHADRPDGYRPVESTRAALSHSDDSDASDEVASRMSRRKGKARAPMADAVHVRVTRSEWEALNAELATLRAAVGSNERLLRAIAEHLHVAPASSTAADDLGK